MKTYKHQALQVNEDILPLTEFKTNASKILNMIRKTRRAVVITQNGKPSAVVIPPEEFDRYREREEFINHVSEGHDDIRAGRVRDTREVEKILDREFGKLR